jgi:methanogenic corrinoid protein MtbC1
MAQNREDEARARDEQVAGELQRAYADALLAGAPRRAEAAIREAMEAGLGEAVIDDRIIRPALQLVGDLWESGHISIADEHLATSISIRVLALQRDAFRLARERSTRRILLAGAEGELHVVGLEMAASLLLHAGYDVRLFGADLPVSEVGDAVATHTPVAVGFTTARQGTAENLPAAFEAVRRASPETGIVVGGRGARTAWSTGFDVVVCEHVSDAVEHIDALVRRAARN